MLMAMRVRQDLARPMSLRQRSVVQLLPRMSPLCVNELSLIQNLLLSVTLERYEYEEDADIFQVVLISVLLIHHNCLQHIQV